MKQPAFAPALLGAIALSITATPAWAMIETEEAKAEAAAATREGLADMQETFGTTKLKPGAFLWKGKNTRAEVTRVVVSLSDQLAFAYRDDELIGVSTISSGTKKNPTPTGIFPIMEKKTMHRSRKYDNAPMPYMQRLDTFGIAMHAGHLPGYPASHGCVRLPSPFASKLFASTKVGTEVLIGERGGSRMAMNE
jgi:hypothetical protein